jgi:MoaA/NifB/PqqE/SkfB family radical SAM enzyme
MDPTRVVVEPTTRCNLDCHTCMRRSWSEPGGDMPAAIHSRLLADLRELPSVREVAYWGIGEPLMHPGIGEMIAAATRQGLRTELITNAHLLDRPRATELVDAGLGRIVVSVDGVGAESLRRVRPDADLDVVHAAMAALRTARGGRSHPEIALQFVLMRRNLDELPRLPALAEELGATRVFVTNVLPYSEDLAGEILYPLSATNAAFAARVDPGPGWTLPRIDAQPDVLAALRGMGLKPTRPSLRGIFAPTLDETACPYVTRGALAVAWDGTVCPCVELLHDHRVFVMEREKWITRHAVGSLADHSLPEIWASPAYRAFRARVEEFDFSPCAGCGGCDLAETNGEDCIGSPAPSCGDCLWARGVVLCP